ncbi:MAG TPA: hypothetical protein VM030_11205 [Acidimicrobiales bacterium]|nr:hypothetical protein [Acidimicrobiales bacterium]
MSERVIRRVVITGVPTATYQRHLTHIEELVHELRLMDIGEASAPEPAPVRVRRLMEEVLERYKDARDASRQQVEAAGAAGDERFDLVIDLPYDEFSGTPRLLEIFEEADEVCRGGGLLTLAAPPDVVAMRRWIVPHIAAQLGGAAPLPYPE